MSDDKTRTRFSAVIEEMTVEIKPLMKPGEETPLGMSPLITLVPAVAARAAALLPGMMNEDMKQMREDRIEQLAEFYAGMLGLIPFNVYRAKHRDLNMGRGIPSQDWDRRTGRTWRGLLEAIAKVTVQDAGKLYVLTSSSTHTKELIRYVWGFYQSLRLRVMEPLHTVCELPQRWRDRDDPDVVLYVDHHYEELRTRKLEWEF